ncbi:lipooligosaccharide transport system permease protein [Actinokineospora baliensis]|uniref:ABC transporter permease n=1 Tax=Actinokineospora baliensis TaxID=547056 RepID=UPI0019566027|nr:ABC transporter permease [Actinokineospora baliensis]MBM7772490.1 lipooligosaccharide transport system permease protein [Actinokineospora baliensis]
MTTATRAHVPATPTAVWLVVEGLWAWYRRNWRSSAVSSVIEPVLFLLALGLGFGSQIQPSAATGGLPYVQYLAPALVVASALQTAAFESTYPVLAAFKWKGTFLGVASTPITSTQLALGQLLWIFLRLSVSSVAFLVIAALLGAVTSLGVIGSLFAALLAAMAFAAPVVAYSATLQSEGQQFSAIFRFIVVPMTVFAGTFFPVDQLPAWVRPIVWLTPLWHGTELSRASAFGTGEFFPVLGHLAFLVALVVIGGHFVVRNFARRLEV